MTSKKKVKLIMPVGVDAGKEVMVTQEEADSITKTFGEYTGPKPGSDKPSEDPAQEVLLNENTLLKEQLKDAQDKVTKLEADIDVLNELIESDNVSSENTSSTSPGVANNNQDSAKGKTNGA